MTSTILVPAIGDDGDKQRFEAGLFAARLIDAHIDFLHVRLDEADLLGAASMANIGSIILPPEAAAALTAENEGRAQRALQTMRDFCRAKNVAIAGRPASQSDAVSASWCELIGDATEQLIWRARFADFLVLGSSRHDGLFSLETQGTILLKAGCPLLLAPTCDLQELSGTMVIAWKDAPEAARAVAAALPFLSRAKRVVIVIVDEGGRTLQRSPENLLERLRWHGVMGELKRVPADSRSGADVLCAEANNVDADLLVMGGYGHSRVRELMFGGFTHRVLGGIERPVLVCH